MIEWFVQNIHVHIVLSKLNSQKQNTSKSFNYIVGGGESLIRMVGIFIHVTRCSILFDKSNR